jgi:hypothetical protein
MADFFIRQFSPSDNPNFLSGKMKDHPPSARYESLSGRPLLFSLSLVGAIRESPLRTCLISDQSGPNQPFEGMERYHFPKRGNPVFSINDGLPLSQE